jgi:alkanesulfonate monooxygenase SsuD/methylene tetrahydromethanopterin reductase-like flavin-dependent oxidoreductase (luciferase family)
MRDENMGIAFRSSTIPPADIVKFVKVVDQSDFTHAFVNDSSRAFDCLEICAASLGVSKGIRVGSGVIRLLEHDEKVLLCRLKTLQALSGNRFVLGVGTGNPGPDPRAKIDSLFTRLQSLRTGFPVGEDSTFPSCYIATLRSGIARSAAGKSDGIILNFCSPEHARRVVEAYKERSSAKTEFACYLKVFYGKTKASAEKLLVEEFKNYANLAQYRKLFESDGILEDISSADQGLRKNGSIPESLLRISLANPSPADLREYVQKFRDAGISLPCVYPYFSNDAGFDFGLETIRSMVAAF